MAPCLRTNGNVSYSDSESEDPRKTELGEEIDDDDDTEESTVSSVNIKMRNYQGRGRRRVRNNIKQSTEKGHNVTQSKRNKKKGKVEKDEETRSRHNKMERDRRREIKAALQNLASVMMITSKLSKAALLRKARNMITDLREEERKYSVKSKKLKEQNEILEQKFKKLQKHFK